MRSPDTILESTDWSSLYHAYGPATDTPGHLRALLSPDPDARKAALSHLWSAVLHQGTPWTVTPLAALVIAGLLEDPRVDAVRTDLLSFLTEVVSVPRACGVTTEELHRMAKYEFKKPQTEEDYEALYEDEEATNAMYAQVILAVMRISPELTGAMLEGLRSENPSIRARAGMGAAELVAGQVPDLREALTAQLIDLLATDDSDERAAHTCSLAMLGAIPERLLSDPSPAVRMCAALGPQFATSPVATSVLLESLEDPEAIDDWFTERPPHFEMRPRFRVVRALIERTPNFDDLLPVAETIARITSKECVDFDWGPLLAAAFPEKDGAVKTEAQRRYLAALVNNAKLWDRRCGNAHIFFKRIGLPYDREACRKLTRKGWRFW